MAKRGRPEVLDVGGQRRFCALIHLGCELTQAAKLMNVSVRTVRLKARKDPEFDQAWRQAEMAALLKPLDTLQKAASENWRAASWLMERMYPMRFVRQDARYISASAADAYLREMGEEVLRVQPDVATRKKLRERLLQLGELWQRDWGPSRYVRKGPEKLPASEPDVRPCDDVTASQPKDCAEGGGL